MPQMLIIDPVEYAQPIGEIHSNFFLSAFFNLKPPPKHLGSIPRSIRRTTRHANRKCLLAVSFMPNYIQATKYTIPLLLPLKVKLVAESVTSDDYSTVTAAQQIPTDNLYKLGKSRHKKSLGNVISGLTGNLAAEIRSAIRHR
jgi:hypothetical protein